MGDLIGWRHVITLFLSLGMAVAYTLRVCMSVAVVAMNTPSSNPEIPVYHWNQTIITTILSSFYWGYLFMQMPAGYFVRKKSAKNLLALCMGVSSAIHICLPWLAKFSYLAVIGGRVAMGITQCCFIPATSALMSRWVPPSERSRLGSFIMNGVPIGTIAAMLISGYLSSSSIGWPSIFYFFGFCGILWSIVFYYLCSDYPANHPWIGCREAQYIKTSFEGHLTDSSENKKLEVPWKSIFTSIPLIACICANCGSLWGYFLFLNLLPTYMKNILQYDLTESGTLSALPYLAVWLTNFPISFLADYALKKDVQIGTVRKVCTVVANCIPGVGILLLGTLSTTNKTIIMGILIGSLSFTSAYSSGCAINVFDICPNFAAPVSAYTNTYNSLIVLAIPVLANLIVPDMKDVFQWQTLFCITSVILFVSSIVFLIFGEGKVQAWNDPDKKDKKLKQEVLENKY